MAREGRDFHPTGEHVKTSPRSFAVREALENRGRRPRLQNAHRQSFKT